MNISPEGTAVEDTKLPGAETYAPTAVQHDKSVGERADFKSDFHGIIMPQLAGLHGLLK
jgi:hypothetical protein